MAAIARAATRKVHETLCGSAGLPYTIGAIAEREQTTVAPIEAGQILKQYVAAETAERTAGVKYPAVYVYCEEIANLLTEKFRTFSGKVQMAIETRVSHDHLESLSRDLELYVAAAAEVLDTHRGDWGEGMFFAGGYRVEFGPIKHGGKNFLQTAKVRFEVDVSV